MPRKIAIVGSAERTRELAPFDDPEWEIWGLAWRFFDHPRFTRAYEVHNPEIWGTYVKPEIYGPWMNDPRDGDGNSILVYTLPHVQKQYPGTLAYPVAAACELMGRRYFTSSFSYMLAHAILEDVDEIGIWGVDLVTDEEYTRQRPAAEFLLGIAHAKGIKIHIPEQSALLKCEYVYGLETGETLNDPMEQHYVDKEGTYRKKIDELKTQVFLLEGAASECAEFVAALKANRRGLWCE